MVALAANVWKTDSATALAVLEKHGVQVVDEEEKRVYLLARQRERDIEAGWQFARKGPAQVGRVSRSLWDLPLQSAQDVDRWQRQLGACLGVFDKEDPSQWTPLRRSLGRRIKEHTLIAPCWSLPGKIASIWAVVGADKQIVEVIRPLRKRGHVNCGLAFLPTVSRERHSQFGDHVFVITDFRAAIMLHDRHFAHHSEPLPLLALPLGQPLRPDFGFLPAKKMIFWGELTQELLRAAKDADGCLVTPEQVARWNGGRFGGASGVSQWLQELILQARPWRQAMEDYLRRAAPEDIDRLLSFLELSTAEAESLMAKYPEHVHQRWQQRTEREVRVGGVTVVEKNSAWYLRKGKQLSLLTDAILRVDSVSTGRSPTYHGRVLFDGKELPFSASVFAVDKAPLAWMKDFLLKGGHGMPSLAKRYEKEIIPAALQFHRPETSPETGVRGWIEKGAAFVFDQFRISSQGRLTLALSPPRRGAPTAGVSAPLDLSPQEREVIDDDAHSSVWAVVAAVAANVLAPALHRTPMKVCFCGMTARQGLEIARFMGCVEASGATEHNWPILGRRGSNCLIHDEWYPAWRIGVKDGWHVVELLKVVRPQEVRHIVPRILPLFLQWLGRQGMRLPPAPTLWEATAVKLAEWRGKQEVIGLIRPPGLNLSAFAELLCRAYCKADLAMGKEMEFLQEGLLVYEQPVRKLVATDLEGLFPREEKLVREVTHRSKPAWLINEEWWATQWKAWSEQHGMNKRLTIL